MKTYTAPIRIENWISKKMIQIDQHRREHQQISFFPIIFKENFRQKKRKYKMEKIMNNFSNVEMVFHQIFPFK